MKRKAILGAYRGAARKFRAMTKVAFDLRESSISSRKKKRYWTQAIDIAARLLHPGRVDMP